VGSEFKAPQQVLSPAERKQLSEDIYYLNMGELRQFCDAHAVPYIIHFEMTDGRIVRTGDGDRKALIIDRILHYLATGTIKPRTIFRTAVVSSRKLDRPPLAGDRVLYGRYKNHDPEILKLMKALTAGEFEYGAVAQEVLRACWSRNEAPTYREFAQLWKTAIEAHDRPNPEWAFLSDRAKGSAGPGWKRFRSQKAAGVMAILKRIT
jgi:hypothetical protein